VNVKYKKHIAQLVFAVFFITLTVQTVFSEDTPPVGQSKSRPVTDEEGISADIFGKKGGRVHPFLLFDGVYTDNVFRTNSETKDDFYTTIAPGIWLAFPANREKLLSIDTTTSSPGGLNLSRIKPEATRRYQSYFLYSPEFVMSSNFSSKNHTNHRADGLLQYNFNSGIAFDLIDIFNDREEIAGDGFSEILYRHQDNLLDFITAYDSPSGKFKLQATYSNYYLDYKDDPVAYRSRDDNTVGISAFYRFWPKTSLFAEYNYAVINFDTGTINDSVENRYYAGVNWDITAKTRGTFKLGYMDKNFESATVEDQDGFSFELQTQHNFTPKRALQLNGYQKFHESDIANASSYLSTGIDVGLMQRFTEKWSGTLNAIYEANDYNESIRDDDLYGISPAIRFKAKKWLIFDLGYQYFKNDSNITIYAYEEHQVFFRASLSM